ncbi:hypothetical protein Q5691_26955 [Microcoleus sp. w1-18aA5]|uniref:hypothetical protein n=1 Tax=Microcoleus sp. w1-18aA5 TaxID=2818982 RepID=UPI002FD26580
MPNPKGHEDSIKDSRFKAAWQSGPTRTIRVPIALANATLDYARQLDNKQSQSRDTADSHSSSALDNKQSQSRDTADSHSSSALDSKQSQSRDTSGSIEELKRLKGECKRLQSLVSDLRIELYHRRRPEIELPDAADLLNRLKAKRKKSAATLADIEAILEMIEG